MAPTTRFQSFKDAIIKGYDDGSDIPGTWRIYYPVGGSCTPMIAHGNYDEHGEMDGEWRAYYKSKNPYFIGRFQNGKQVGDFRWYHDSEGAMSCVGLYKDGVKEGTWTEFWENGQPKITRIYKEGVVIEKTEWNIDGVQLDGKDE
jgi:antitoxin component YwqK of YwqJK toxin-antitoxin module